MTNRTFNQRKAHLGTGVSFPFRQNLQGGTRLSYGEQSVEEAIRIILRTELGERVYRPDFGCRLSEMVFAPMNPQTLMLMRLYVQEALERWEPRIILENVSAVPDPIRGRVDLMITYQLKETHDIRSMVYPFYLRSSEEETQPS